MLPSLENSRIWGIPIRTLVVASITGIFLWNVWLRVAMVHQHRVESGGVEPNVIHGIQKLMLGQVLYTDPEQVPFDVIQYTPAYYLICAGIGDLVGLKGDDARSIILLSRSVALALWLLMGWFVYRACRSANGAQWSSILAAGIAMCIAWEQSYSRMDALVAGTSAATVLFFLKWCSTGRGSFLVLSSIVAVTGLFSKQSGIVMVVAPLLYLVITRQWHPLRTYLISVVCAATAWLLITFQLGTPLAFYQNTVLGLRNGLSREMYAVLVEPATYKYFIGWHLLLVMLVVRGWRSGHRGLRFLAVASSFSLAFALITGAKSGSGLNYLHESLMLTFIGLSVLIAQDGSPRWRNVFAWSFAIYGGVLAAFRTNSTLTVWRNGEPDSANVEFMHQEMDVRDVLRNDLGLAADEKIFIAYRGYLELFFTGQSMLTQKDIVQNSTVGLFDYTRFHRVMSDGTVRFVITDGPPVPVAYLDSTYVGWEPIRTVHGRTILARSARP